GVALKRRDDGRASGGRRVFCSVQSSSPPPAWPGRAVPELGYKTWEGQKPISIVGSTGSIGTQTLDIVAENPDKFRVVALAAGSNIALLVDQPTVAAIEAGKDIALANKETLIAGGPFVLPLARKHNKEFNHNSGLNYKFTMAVRLKKISKLGYKSE
ncbi:hypothetical protein RYX36_026205, partial [Vicia faba]